MGGVSGCGRQREMWMVRGDQPHICSLHDTMTKHVNISYKDWFCLTLSKIHPRISFPVKSFRLTQPYKSNGRFLCARFLLNVYRVTTLRKCRFLVTSEVQRAVIIISSIEIDTRQWVALTIAQNAWHYELFIISDGAKLNAKALWIAQNSKRKG